MTTQQNIRFRVLDAAHAPGGGQVLRLRLEAGEMGLKALKGATLEAHGPGGEEARIRVRGFALVGGRPSQARFSRTGRVDVITEPANPGSHDTVGLQWEARLAR